jgi:hypothetical protein
MIKYWQWVLHAFLTPIKIALSSVGRFSFSLKNRSCVGLVLYLFEFLIPHIFALKRFLELYDIGLTLLIEGSEVHS